MKPSPAGGVCPRCAAGFLKGTPTEPFAAGEGKHAFTPPTVAELTARFPQLEILGFVGQGGMGAVYKARQRQLDRVVALKILPPDIGDDPAFAERFAREAKALARLSHPGIVTIHDFGRADGLFYFLMEFVDGVSLGQLMRGGRVSPREALAIVPQICDALQYAHDQGLVHRDIKPENILLDRRGRVKVADFGLVKLVEGGGESTVGELSTAASPNLTEAGKVMGTPHYMAPEQVSHPAEVDHRADIYALGVVFYQMLTGELPGKPLQAPSKKVQVDVRLDEVVLRALEGEPERRYQQASQLRTAVETIIPGTDPTTQEPNAGTSRPGSSSKEAKLQPVHQFSRIGILLAVVCLGAIVVGITLWRRDRDSRAERSARAVATAASVYAVPAEKGAIGLYLAVIGTVESTNAAAFTIPENRAPEIVRDLHSGQRVAVQAFDSGGEHFGDGALESVANEIDTATGTLKCKASLVPDSSKLMIPGYFLELRVLLGLKEGVVRVPADALVREQPPIFVWVIKPDRTLTRRNVEAGTVEEKEPPTQTILARLKAERDRQATDDGRPRQVLGPWAEIRSGLAPGELVVVGPHGDLHEGQRARYELMSVGSTHARSPKAEQMVYANPPPGSALGKIDWFTVKPLSGWISDLQNPDPGVRKLAEHTIAETGTNALPEFLKILSDPEQGTEADDRRYNTAAALKFIGPEVRSAIPDFVRLMFSGNQEMAYAGARALAFTSPMAPEPFPALTNALTDPSAGVRDAATHGVGLVLSSDGNSIAEPTIPILLHNLSDHVSFVRADTAAALMSYVQFQRTHGRAAKPEQIIPPIIKLLQDDYSFAREYASMTLKGYGDAALPVLRRLLQGSNDETRACATNALRVIGYSPSIGTNVISR